MSHINFNYNDLRDKIYGCWTGKNIAGTLGAPFEGQNKILEVTGYTNATSEPLMISVLRRSEELLKYLQKADIRSVIYRFCL